MAPTPYTYKAKCLSVHDGDTITVDVDLGFKEKLEGIKLRLLGVNTPELKTGAPAIKATDFVKAKILGKDIIIQTQKADAFGRWLAVVFLPNDVVSINDMLLQNGLAVVYKK